jgi:hypothetical protein
MTATWTLTNSIVSGNTSVLTAADIENQGPLLYAGANLVQTVVNTGTGSVSGPAPSSTAPLLAALGSNGGPTQTMPPLTGSPAINASVGSTITTDQRGIAVTGVPDIGACELTHTISNIADLTVNEDSADAARTVAFTIGNVPASPVLSATSTNAALVPSFTFGGSGASRTVLLNVPANANGSAIITVTVSNGPDTAIDSFLLTVTPVNDVPTLAAIGHRILSQSAGLQTVNLTGIGSGAANEAQTLTITATSSNPAIIPHPTVNYTSPAASGSLSFTPAAAQTGLALITVTVSDGGLSTTRTFYVSVPVSTSDNVTHPGDSGTGSLRQAIADALAASGSRSITFNPVMSGQTITLASEIVLNDSTSTDVLTIDATSLPGGLTLDGGPGTNRIFSLASGDRAALHGLTLTGGGGAGASSSGNGGAILNNGTLTLTQCTLSGNTASRNGGAIYNFGTLTLTQCTLSENFSNSSGGFGSQGGAIYNSEGTLTLTQCTLLGNTANGGNDGRGNGFGGSGGAIYSHSNGASGTLALTQCTLSGNTANAGFGNGFGGSGGAIYSHSNGASGTLALTQCTLSGNTATNASGGSFGRGGAIVISDITATLTNSLIAGNTASTGPDIYFFSGTLTRSGANLIGNNVTVTAQFPASSPNANGDFVGTSAAPLNPLLAPLGNYGGPTQTMRLLPGSPALNRIASPLFPTDQRGFPIVGLADIGAYESGARTLAPIADQIILADTSTDAIPFPIGTDGTAAAPLTLTAASSNTPLVPNANAVFGGSGVNRTITATPAAAQTGTTTLTVTVTDGYDTVSTSFQLTVLPNTGYNTWKLAQFGSNALNPAIAGDNADADNDGQSTFLEYATRGQPLAPSTNPFSPPQANGPAYQFTFPYRTGVTDLRYIVQRSTTLSTWTEIYRLDTATSIITEQGNVNADENPSTQIITVTDPDFTPGGTFWRLVVEQQ